jgi:hypothetical protein
MIDITPLLFAPLKTHDAFRRRVRPSERGRLIYTHPGHPFCVRALYLEPLDRTLDFCIHADPGQEQWREHIRVGPGLAIENRYHLTVVRENVWRLTPTWRTLTTAIIDTGEIDMTDPARTVVSFEGNVEEFRHGLSPWLDHVRSRFPETEAVFDGG